MAALLRILLASAVLSGCSVAAPAEGDGEVEDHAEAVSSCGTANYNAALAHYRNAVAWSKDRLARGVCESEYGYQWGIADEASRAVMTCGEFRNILRTSVWAAPVRTVLATSLTLRSLTGELKVIRDSSFQNWSGAETFFPKGISFWARAEGAYGSAVRIDFRASGKATWGQHEYNATTGDITWGSSPATYTISKATESGKRTVKVTHHGRTEVYTLRVENGWRYNDAPIFALEPAASSKMPKLYSLVSECDA